MTFPAQMSEGGAGKSGDRIAGIPQTISL